MSRYISAATKVSRLALGSLENRPIILGSLENRPIIQVYSPPRFARQTERMGEDVPFATHGGLAVRHTFPLDAEYVFKLRLQRGGAEGPIGGGIAENEYEIELRVDHALMKRFKLGGRYKGRVRGGVYRRRAFRV